MGCSRSGGRGLGQRRASGEEAGLAEVSPRPLPLLSQWLALLGARAACERKQALALPLALPLDADPASERPGRSQFRSPLGLAPLPSPVRALLWLALVGASDPEQREVAKARRSL